MVVGGEEEATRIGIAHMTETIDATMLSRSTVAITAGISIVIVSIIIIIMIIISNSSSIIHLKRSMRRMQRVVGCER